MEETQKKVVHFYLSTRLKTMVGALVHLYRSMCLNNAFGQRVVQQGSPNKAVWVRRYPDMRRSARKWYSRGPPIRRSGSGGIPI